MSIFGMKRTETIDNAAYDNTLSSEQKQQRIDSVMEDLKKCFEENRDFVVLIISSEETEDGKEEGVLINGATTFDHHELMLRAFAAQYEASGKRILALYEKDEKNE